MDKDLEEINRQAMETIDQLARGDMTSLISTPKGSVWETGASETDRYSPSAQPRGTTVPLTTSIFSGSAYSPYVPRTYYGTGRYYGEALSSPEAFHRKIVNAVYKADGNPQPTKAIKRKAIKMDEHQEVMTSKLSLSGRSLFSPSEVNTRRADKFEKNQRSKILTEDAKNQMIAITLSGAAKIASSLLINWAKSNRVPYELL